MAVESRDLEKLGVKFVEAGFLDPDGVLRSMTFPVRKLDELLSEGFGFDGYSTGYADIEDSDLVARPIPSTMRVYSIDGVRSAFFICDLEKDGKPLEHYPRNVLKRMLEESPYDVLIGPEVEFCVLKSGEVSDRGLYMASHPDDELEFAKRELMEELENLGFEVEVSHHEVGPGQHEITFKASDPLKVADDLVFYKKFLKAYFRARGYAVTFMPKPFKGLAGNGMHLHMSLWMGGKSVFSDGEGLTEEALHFIGGLLKYAREIAVYTNSTVNSYKRLVPGFEAPVYLLWGYGNRSVLVRVPKYRKMTEREARVEYRAPDPAGNLYLTFAAVIAAGLKGIEERADPGEAFCGNAYELEHRTFGLMPSSLHEALEADTGSLERLRCIRSRYRKLKEKEWREYREYLEKSGLPLNTLDITEWERSKYMGR